MRAGVCSATFFSLSGWEAPPYLQNVSTHGNGDIPGPKHGSVLAFATETKKMLLHFSVDVIIVVGVCG